MKECDIAALNRILKREYMNQYSPVKEFTRVRAGESFRILVAAILSSRTKDETTSGASSRLFAVVRKPADFRRLTLKQIERLIFPVGFYHTKAKHLNKLPGVLDSQFQGRIPETIDELCQLPGVGRKVANLVVAEAFDKPAICVDVHVHRISNRLGLVKTKTPFETEMALRKKLPVRYWKNWNGYLVAYGQTVCTPTRPFCSRCIIRPHCARKGLTRSR